MTRWTAATVMALGCAMAACGSSPAAIAKDPAVTKDAGPDAPDMMVLGGDDSGVPDDSSAGTDSGAPPASVAVEQCSNVVGAFVYAEHLYPGIPVATLASVRAYGHRRATTPLPGYTFAMTLPYVDDGKVAVDCGSAYDYVTFVLP